jgi:type I restriction-modification system DNA methylase subunit
MNFVKRYVELHKQLIRKERNLSMEILFLTWSYLSSKKEFGLPEELTIKYWSSGIYSNKRDQDLKQIFLQIEQRLPRLKGSFTGLFEAHVNRYKQGETIHDLDLFASIFNRFEYQQAEQNDWQEILNIVISDVVRKQKQLNSDPLDISKLAANIFTGQLARNSPKNKAKNTVFIPSLSIGTLAIEIANKFKAKLRYRGFESNLEAFCVAVLSFTIHGIDTSGLSFGDSKDFRQDLEDLENFERILKIIAFNSEIGIAIISQSFLFSNKYTNIRRHLIYDSNLATVISISPSTSSSTKVRSAILVFNKRTDSDKILLVNGEKLEFNNRRIVNYESKDIDFLTHIVSHQIEHEGISKFFDVVELRTNNYSLLVSHRLPEAKDSIKIKEIQKKIIVNQQKLMSLEISLQGHFAKMLN